MESHLENDRTTSIESIALTAQIDSKENTFAQGNLNMNCENCRTANLFTHIKRGAPVQFIAWLCCFGVHSALPLASWGGLWDWRNCIVHCIVQVLVAPEPYCGGAWASWGSLSKMFVCPPTSPISSFGGHLPVIRIVRPSGSKVEGFFIFSY